MTKFTVIGCIFAALAWTGTAHGAFLAAFDYGGSTTPVQSGFTQVVGATANVVTTDTNGVGIQVDTNASGTRDRGTTGLAGNPDADVLRDLVFFSTSDAITVTLTGLAGNTTYDIIAYSFDSNSGNNDKVINFTTNGGTVQHTTDSANASTAVFNLAPLTTDGSGSGTIVVDHVGGSGGAVSLFNGFAVVIPEPASLALLGLGGLLIVRRK